MKCILLRRRFPSDQPLKAVWSEHPRSVFRWQRISAFRNILVHNYLGIDLEMIWQIIERDIPELKVAVLDILNKMP